MFGTGKCLLGAGKHIVDKKNRRRGRVYLGRSALCADVNRQALLCFADPARLGCYPRGGKVSYHGMKRHWSLRAAAHLRRREPRAISSRVH